MRPAGVAANVAQRLYQVNWQAEPVIPAHARTSIPPHLRHSSSQLQKKIAELRVDRYEELWPLLDAVRELSSRLCRNSAAFTRVNQ